jgi:hypothetical protein
MNKPLLEADKKEEKFLGHLPIKESLRKKAEQGDMEALNEIILEFGMERDSVMMELDKFRKPNYAGGYQMQRNKYAEGSLLQDDMAMMDNDMPMDKPIMEQPVMDELMMEESPENDMAPDEKMEADYLDFILDEALTDEEEEMLMSKLEQDEQMAMLFDKVVDVAQEFAGSGPVEGPGSGVSDSIPARLSDGEFVFTAKAVEEIGADELMRMMKDAEMKADQRQGLAEGGEPEEEETVVMPVEQPATQQDIRVTKTTVGAQASQQEVNDLVDEEVKKSMLRGSRNLG